LDYKKWTTDNKSTSKIEKVVFIGLSLAAFHALARSEIININPIYVLNDFRIIAKIIKGSVSDFLFVSALTGIFVITLQLLKNKKVENVIYLIFIFLALFSILIAFINISIVVYLGKPFTYQWLYYSDFLGSNEAKNAFQENLSFWIAINLILLSLSMFLLSGVLRITYRILTINKRLKYITYSFIIFVLIGLILIPFKTKVTWTEGQSENAITAMVRSVFEAYSNSSFFSAEIPKDIKSFNPSQGTKIETPLAPFKEHNVKNVLFIVLESAGAAYFDGYGGPYQLSPNLNKYASQSLIFDNMYAHAPSTNKSMISILGSIYPFVSYQSITTENPDIEHPTLSSVLKNKGYKTSFFTSADLRFQNSKEFLAHRGFDIVEDFTSIKCSEEFHFDTDYYSEGNGIDDMCLVDRLSSWLDEDSTQNFFSMIWTVQGHHPYFFAQEEEDFGVSNYNHNRYLNCLKHYDELIGKVMQILEEKELSSTTIVVVIGDHGEAFGQHKQYGHGTALYEENLKVPLYFINSTLFHGERKFDIAGMKDVPSTTLSIIDVDIPKNWQGLNLLDTYSDEVFYFAPWSDFLFGYRKANMKYIFNETRNTVEVFDLSKDPQEKTNLFETVNKNQLFYARNRVGAWVQYQDKFVKELLNK
jgi:arylsulfatase A-like enzyme